MAEIRMWRPGIDGSVLGNHHQAHKKLAQHAINISTCNSAEVFFQCVNRLYGCIYVIKNSKKSGRLLLLNHNPTLILIIISTHKTRSQRGVGKHDNVVRYCSAWLKDDHMLIENEFSDDIQDHLSQSELKIMPKHVIEGLHFNEKVQIKDAT